MNFHKSAYHHKSAELGVGKHFAHCGIYSTQDVGLDAFTLAVVKICMAMQLIQIGGQV